MKTNWWVESGMAAQAAQELVWFVVIVVVGIGIMAWRDMRKEGKQDNKPAPRGSVNKGGKK
jgi:hypothetical protein